MDHLIVSQQRIRGQGYEASPVEQDYRVAPQGSMPSMDFFSMLIARGYVYNVPIGAFSTPIVGGGNGTVLDLDQPEGVISCPRGFTMIPLRVHVQCQPPLIAADNDEIEILLAADIDAAWAKDGTYTTEYAFNMRTDLRDGSQLSCASAFTADMTATTGADPVLSLELAREVKAADVQGTAANAKFDDCDLLYEPMRPPLLVGPCAMYLYWGGTVAMSGFAQLMVAAVPSTWFTSLE